MSTPEANHDAKKEAKRLKRLVEDRPLDPWERYRALNDALDEAYELIDIANRKARFALIVMGALNALLFIAATRNEIAAAIPAGGRSWLLAFAVLYAIVAIYFLLQAIETLRPRKFRPRLPEPPPADMPQPAGLRYYEDVLRRDALGHVAAWREAYLAQINTDLAAQGYSLALKNDAKYAALRRLYVGLRVMTLLAGVFLTALAFFAIRGVPA